MASTVLFIQHNGTAAGTPPRELTATTGISSLSYKSIDDSSSSYTAYPVTGGTNSYDTYVSLLFNPTFNTLLNLKMNHVSGNIGGGLTIAAVCSGSGFYTTPTQSTNANLTRILTTTGLINTGLVMPFVTTGAFNNDYVLTSTGINGTGRSVYFISQLQTTLSASPGDISTITYGFSWDEN